MNRFMRKTPPLQADNIEASESGAIAERKAERDEVVLDAGETAHERVGADANELMHSGAPA